MSKMKVAVIGLGHAANDFHLPVLTGFDDVEIYLCDAWPERLAEGKEKWRIPEEKCFDDIDKMMGAVSLNASYVLLPQYVWRGRPPSPHKEVVKSVLAYGKPVFVEKPLSMTYPDAKELADAAADAGVTTTQVGYQRRFNPLLTEGLKLVRERGPLLNCTFGFFKGEKPYNAEVDVIPIPPYDYLTLDFIHCLDLMRWAPQSDMTEFFSTTGRVGVAPELTQFHAMGKFENGCTSIFSSNMRAGARALDFQLHGIGISVYITMAPGGSHYSSMKATVFTDNDYENPKYIYDYELAPDNSALGCVGFWQENRHFIDCVKSDIRTSCDFSDAAKTSELADIILKKIPAKTI
jgi:virulence factor